MSRARHLALDILLCVEHKERTLDHFLSRRTAAILQLNRADRALLHHLVYGVLRWRLRLDWYIDLFTQKPNKQIKSEIRNILRLGFYQMLYLDRIPKSAVVNTSVNLTKQSGHPWAAGFVNGLLRRAADHNDLDAEWAAKRPVDDPVTRLSVEHAFPPWLIARWYRRFGLNDTADLCAAINTIPSITLRTNTLRTTRQHLLEAITGDEAISVSATIYAPEGMHLRSPQKVLSDLGSFQNGEFQIQDEAAQIISHLVAPQPGQTVWDACAGLGTKTCHLAQLMGNQGRIIATDRQIRKLDQLAKETDRLGITIVERRHCDLLQRENIPDLPQCDRILLDAPCSGTGTLQKNPDGKWRITLDDLKRNAQRQSSLLNQAAPYLKPAGILVYAVCSIEPDENENVIERFLARHQDFIIQEPNMSEVANASALTTPKGCLYTLPHRHRMDGFFAVALKKRAG